MNDSVNRDAFEKAATAYREATRSQTMLADSARRYQQDRAQAIQQMRDAGATWEQITQATGLTRQRLWQLTKP